MKRPPHPHPTPPVEHKQVSMTSHYITPSSDLLLVIVLNKTVRTSTVKSVVHKITSAYVVFMPVLLGCHNICDEIFDILLKVGIFYYL